MTVAARIAVQAGDGADYPVVVGPGSLGHALPGLLEERVPAHRHVLISDATVHALHGDRVAELLGAPGGPPVRLDFPPGEASKTRETWAALTDRMLEAGVGRDGCVVALGGGVTGDLAGFVAATYMRGIPVVQLPTSLVAMVDASVGGKTGVDVPAGKNLAGAFHPPRFVLADPELARTLPREERSRGLAEAVKHGAILDVEHLEQILGHARALLAGDPGATAEVVARSVALKARVVSSDERESGLRQVLNFGHTLAHAVERITGFRVPHGEAVSLGMVLEARLGEDLGVTEPGTAHRLVRALGAVGLPSSWDALGEGPAHDPDALAGRIVAATTTDKKARAGAVRYVLLERVGVTSRGEGWSHAPDSGAVRQSLAAALARGATPIPD
ncbi:MAG: 3-dehydroquinate synthase [Gemmatimonadales bacterium]|nr:MAG: 3-dehydroquinate synthase [Gemmatimonadales bacterium]